MLKKITIEVTPKLEDDEIIDADAIDESSALAATIAKLSSILCTTKKQKIKNKVLPW